MDQSRGVLFLSDPLRAGAQGRIIERMQWSAAEQVAGHNLLWIDFPEVERCLPHAQAALWELRRRCGWVCVAAERGCAGVALSLAEQLPVDRLALIGGTPFSPLPEGGTAARRRELRRMDGFARRNLALLVAELLLVGIKEDEMRRMACGLGKNVHVRIGEDADWGCFVEAWQDNGK
ncbi:MAG: hypothetical protein Q4G06_02270 [Clostridia bacterium]|nr:hypothetical protein [Clostridia bacterium]